MDHSSQITDEDKIERDHTGVSDGKWTVNLPLMCYTAGRPFPRSDEEGGKSQEQSKEICNGSTVQRRGAAASKKIGGWRSVPFVFANELCEKLAVVGFSANMITYLTEELHLPLVKAANTLTNFGGTASLTPLLGAFIADAYVGRFWTIAVASIIYQIVASETLNYHKY